MKKSSLDVLEESLVKKTSILNELQSILERQRLILQDESLDFEAFDISVDEQDRLVEEIMTLDSQFGSLFDNVKFELDQVKGKHVEQVVRLKQLNQSVHEMSIFLQQEEEKNKEMLVEHFRKQKMNFSSGRRSSQVAYGYYKSMSQSNVVPPQFMDKKK